MTAAHHEPDAPAALVDHPPVIGVRPLAWVLTLLGALAAFASLDLTIERFKQLKDPGHVAMCDINAMISCGSVMKAPEAELFGFPNSLLGLATFAVVVTTGVVLLTGAKLPRWYWWGLLAGQLVGLLMVHFLMFVSLAELKTLCPWCVVVWSCCIPMFILTLAYMATSGLITSSASGLRRARSIFGYWPVMIVVWLGLVIAAVVVEILS